MTRKELRSRLDYFWVRAHGFTGPLSFVDILDSLLDAERDFQISIWKCIVE